MFGVQPESLRSASKQFQVGADAAGDGAEMVSMLTLDAGALGEVPAAGEFAAAVAKFASEQGEDLRRGSAWYRDAGEGLVENAETYERVDDQWTASFRNIGGGLS
ncbi:type VII secretion target [Actinosynnema pretiosum]|uniref:Uncharacterized protein n=1 Tax=Actinosynnema pretiosum TaxID=42197 RepID=A0A290ZFE3_9PSEU|nr:type VII secretion target [Actinosynnema pretiosum]ATE57692.1 hypothetical protein CNX65_33920 [Actinosynnema pretiosum]